jgi:CHAT domain-containing protein
MDSSRALPRLHLSREEAGKISDLTPGPKLVELDFDASRQIVVSGILADYRMIHFATHAVIDEVHPNYRV